MRCPWSGTAAATVASMADDATDRRGAGLPARDARVRAGGVLQRRHLRHRHDAAGRGPRRARHRRRDEQPRAVGRPSTTCSRRSSCSSSASPCSGRSGWPTTATSAGWRAIDRRATAVNLVYLALHRLPALPVGDARASTPTTPWPSASTPAASPPSPSSRCPHERDRHPPRPVRAAADARGRRAGSGSCRCVPACTSWPRCPSPSSPRRPRSTAGSCCFRSSVARPAAHAEATVVDYFDE